MFTTFSVWALIGLSSLAPAPGIATHHPVTHCAPRHHRYQEDLRSHRVVVCPAPKPRPVED